MNKKIQKKIIVIEDDPDVNLLIQNIFSELDLDADFFNSSKEGLRAISKSFPDIVIMDLMMPGITGFEITDYIRNNPKLKSIRLMVITGYDSPKMRNQIFAYGIDDYLPKPFDVDEFVQKLNRFLQ